MNKIQSVLILLLSILLLAACNSTPVENNEHTIKSITVTHSSGTVSPMYRRSSKLVIKNDLSVSYIVEGNRPSKKTGATKYAMEWGIISNKTGKLTQAQFDKLVASIKHADLSKFKSEELPQSRVGGGRNTTSIETDNKTYDFVANDRMVYSVLIAQLSRNADELQEELFPESR